MTLLTSKIYQPPTPASLSIGLGLFAVAALASFYCALLIYFHGAANSLFPVALLATFSGSTLEDSGIVFGSVREQIAFNASVAMAFAWPALWLFLFRRQHSSTPKAAAPTTIKSGIVAAIARILVVAPAILYLLLFVCFGDSADMLFSSAVQAALTSRTLADFGVTFATPGEKNAFLACVGGAFFVASFYVASKFSLIRKGQMAAA